MEPKLLIRTRAAAAVSAAAAATAVLGQPQTAPRADEAAVRACRQIESDAARLECFDRAADAAPPSAADERRSTPARERPPQRSSGEHSAADEGGAVDAGDETRGAAESPGGRTPGAAAGAATAGSGGISVRIVEIVRPRIGRPRFVADDGSVFAQIDTRRGRYPSVPFDAVLEDGYGDTFFLAPPDGGPRVRVSRAD